MDSQTKPLRIALLGYGRMGRAIEQEAQARGHAIVARIDQHNISELDELGAKQTDVVIEFTHPDAFQGNFKAIMAQGLPLVSGTTGWYQELQAIESAVEAAQGSFLYASNFSVGVQILFQLNQRLAALMDRYPAYDPYIEERHHRHKADAPSGTAHTLAQQVLAGLDRKTQLSDAAIRQRPPLSEELTVGFIRAGEIPGTHTVSYSSPIDSISITHRAHTRQGFALGAVLAAEWLPGRQGCFAFESLFEEA